MNPSQLDGPFLGAKPARTVAGAAPALLFEVRGPTPGPPRGSSDATRSGAVTLSPEIGTNWSGAGALDVADFDGDGVDEAFLATASLYDGYFVAWDFAAGAAAWTSPANIGNGRAMVHADLNGDGAPDLVAITSQGYVHAYDVKHATLLWKSTSIGSGVDVAVADLDGDGVPEIVALTSTRLVLFRKAPSGPTPWLDRLPCRCPASIRGRGLRRGRRAGAVRPGRHVGLALRRRALGEGELHPRRSRAEPVRGGPRLRAEEPRSRQGGQLVLQRHPGVAGGGGPRLGAQIGSRPGCGERCR